MPESREPHRFGDPASLLIRSVNWLGDAVMATPALMRLRERLPRSRITLLVPAKIEPLFKCHPAIDDVLSLVRGHGPLTVARILREKKFDAALVFPNSHRVALEVFLAGIPRRIGVARPLRGWFLTENIAPRPTPWQMRKRSVAEIKGRLAGNVGSAEAAPSPGPDPHQSNDYLHLAAEAFGSSRALLPPQLAVSPEEIQGTLARFGLEQKDCLVGLNPGAEYGPAKRWPAERFQEAAAAVSRQARVRWLLFGVAADATAGVRIADALNATVKGSALNLAGRTDLRELMALIKSCRVLLTNDTGPMHLAAALGTPVVVPFGSTSPELTGPLPRDGHTILRVGVACAPCFRRECPVDFRCMLGVSAEMAAAAVLAHLAGK